MGGGGSATEDYPQKMAALSNVDTLVVKIQVKNLPNLGGLGWVGLGSGSEMAILR